MIRRVTEFCVRERLIITIGVVVVIGFGWYSATQVPLDAIPNVGENQVIVLTEWPGRSPKDVEDQITYPMSVALQSVAGAESVRGRSMFGFSFVQVTFADNVDFYWARSRVAEQLATAGKRLPPGTAPALAPDATALGQIFYYVLEAPPGMNLAEVRSVQDYVVKYALQSVEGVAEVASIGGYVRQYQIEIDPDRLRYHKLSLEQVLTAVRDSNIDVGAKTVETSGMEYVVRGMGFIGANKDLSETLQQIEETVITTRDNVPIRISDVAAVQVGPAFRRGALDWNGQEAVGGVVVMRFGENPRTVINRVKKKIDSLQTQLGGITIRGIYDRTQLVNETVATLSTALGQAILITIVTVVLFLLHVRASLVVAVTLPIAVLIAFIAMYLFGVDANIMSLAGIAIAIGTMVDMGIIISENIYRHLADWQADGERGGREARLKVIVDATAEVAPAVITAVSTTVISFLPVFFLTGRDHRMFAPLAWSKTYSLVASLLVAVILVPLLCRWLLNTRQQKRWTSAIAALSFGAICFGLTFFVWREFVQRWWSVPVFWTAGLVGSLGGLAVYWMMRERLKPIEDNPVARLVNACYAPMLRLFLRYKKSFLVVPLLIVLVGLAAWLGLPRVFKPLEHVAGRLGADLNAIALYVDLKHAIFQKGIPEDDWIALDEGSWFYMPSLYPAASLSQAMEVLQTQDAMIREIPEVENVLGKIGRVDSALDPAPAGMIETYVILKPRDQWRPGMTEKKVWELINDVASMPGITMADELQPIEGRVVMLQSGIKASMAIRIYGDTLERLSMAATAVADKLRTNRLVKPTTVNPDIVMGKPYVEFEVDREQSARYGMTVRQVNQVIEAALGGTDATTTVEGRERYAIQIRYQRDLRENMDQLGAVPVVTNTGEVVPLERLAKMKTTWGPAWISSEDSRLVAHVAFSPIDGVGAMQAVEGIRQSLTDARQEGELVLPANFEIEPVGSFENQLEANQRLMVIIPLVLLVNIFIIYLQFRRLPLSLAVFSGIPVAFAGGMIALAVTGAEINTAVWVGFIALFGIAIDDGVVIGTYLNQVMVRRRLASIQDIRNATVEAGLRRIRPCLMTTITTLTALAPVLLATGRGADVARAMALPVFGGMLVELITLFVVPVVYCGILEFKFNGGIADTRFEVVRADETMVPAA